MSAAREGVETVGVLGGTFDPIHLGHLGAAEHVRTALGLGRVLLLPSGRPPHKRAGELTPRRHREAMVRLALAGRPGLALSTLELERGGVSYTVDTLRELSAGPPALRPLFVLGFDSLLQLPTWHAYRHLVAEFDLAVVDRNDPDAATALDAIAPELAVRWVELGGGGVAEDPGRGGRIFHLAMEPIRVSSSEIRRRAAAGARLDALVPPAVAEYIHRTGIYRQESTS